MCESRIHDKCSGEKTVKLSDGRHVCPACAMFNQGGQLDREPTLVTASGLPLTSNPSGNLKWDLS